MVRDAAIVILIGKCDVFVQEVKRAEGSCRCRGFRAYASGTARKYRRFWNAKDASACGVYGARAKLFDQLYIKGMPPS